MSPRADRPDVDPGRAPARRLCTVVVVPVLVAGAVLAGAGPATAVPTGESWGAELAIAGGDDTGVRLADGGVRLIGTATPAGSTPATSTPASPTSSAPATSTPATSTPATPTGRPGSAATAAAPPTGVLMLAPRRPAAATNAVTAALTADRPADTAVTVDVRGVRSSGAWSDWVEARPGSAARLPEPTTEIQVRLTLRGSRNGTSPVVRGLWLTTSSITGPAGPTSPAGPTTPSVPPAPTPTPLTPGTPGATSWTADIAKQGLGAFKDTPYNITGGATVKVVDGPPKAIRFTVPSGASRAEIEPSIGNLTDGQQRFFRLRYVLPASFPVGVGGFQLVSQWKNSGDGSPPVELRVENGRFVLGGGFGYPGGSRLFRTDIGPAVAGRAVDLVVGIRFDTDPKVGSVDVWLDGTRRVTGFRPPGGTLYPGKYSYWKVGLYRDSGLKGPAVADLTDARTGPTYASVTS